MKFNLPSNYKHSLLLIPFPIIKNWLALSLSYSFVLLYHGIDKTNGKCLIFLIVFIFKCLYQVVTIQS